MPDNSAPDDGRSRSPMSPRAPACRPGPCPSRSTTGPVWRPATRRRILDVATDLGWQPSLRGRSLSSSTSFTLGLVIARSATSVGTDPFFPAFVAGVNTLLVPRQQSLLFTVVPDTDAEIATYRRLAAEQRVDGVLLTDLLSDDPRPRWWPNSACPPSRSAVRTRPRASASRLGVGRRRGRHARGGGRTRRAGHRRIAHVTGPERYLHVRHRRDAWAAALSDAGLPAARCVHTDFSRRSGRRGDPGRSVPLAINPPRSSTPTTSWPSRSCRAATRRQAGSRRHLDHRLRRHRVGPATCSPR